MGNVPVRNEDSRRHHEAADTLQEEGPLGAATEVAPKLLPPFDLTEFDRPVAPQLALRSDGVVLLSTEELAQYDLSARRRWTGIELTLDEFAEVSRRFAGVAEEAAAHVGGKLGKKKGGHS